MVDLLYLSVSSVDLLDSIDDLNLFIAADCPPPNAVENGVIIGLKDSDIYETNDGIYILCNYTYGIKVSFCHNHKKRWFLPILL